MSRSVIGALRVSLGLDSAAFAQGLDQAQNRMADFGRRMQRVGAAVSVVGAGLAIAIRGQLRSADELGKAATRIGMPVEELSRLTYAADLAGVSFSQLEDGLRQMSRRMVENADDFEALGVAVRDAEGQMRPSRDVLDDVADALAAMPEGAERTAAAMDVFGRSGANLVPLLVDGAEAMRALGDESDRMGQTISGETAAAAAEFNDNLRRLTGTIGGIVQQITAELAPVLVSISEAFVSFSEVFQGLSPEVRRFSAVAAGLTVVLGPLLIAAGLLITALSAISAPVLAVVAAIAALTAAVVAFWPEIMEFKDRVVEGAGIAADAFWDMKERMEAAIVGVVASVRETFGELVDWFRGLPAQMVQIGRDIIDGLVAGITDRYDSAKARIQAIPGDIVDGFRGILRTRSPSLEFAEIGRDLMDGLEMGIEAHVSGPLDALSDMADTMSGAFANAFTGIITGARRAEDAMRQLLEQLANMLLNRAFQQLFGNMFGGGGIPFGGFRAMGGPVSPGRAYMVGERGPEMFVPSGAGQILPSGGGGVVVNVINQNGSSVGTSSRRGSDGREVIDLMISDSLSGGRQDGAMRRFGMSPEKVRR